MTIPQQKLNAFVIKPQRPCANVWQEAISDLIADRSAPDITCGIKIIIRPGHCPEILEILKFVLKRPEIGVRF